MRGKIMSMMLILILLGCVDSKSHKVYYSIFNETDKTVTVVGYNSKWNSEKKGMADPIYIASHSHYKIVRIISDDDHQNFYSLRNGGVDSVRVVFEDQKLLVYTWKDVRDGNAKALSIINGQKVDDKHYAHHITEEDYAQAVDCEEDCY
ncbi:hypothetical protein DN752_03455 [Echinicola strongylocentroti]|uniref:Uncharacterized protein n=1 Tax=Echinicola strongylocentroti TaxID=1795355 RepID=A0A2Z4IDY5_9BACT|nr:hypothetical protein [Echinicola strongylocentroti]AWW29272.1 hypothetical protein DN752_03455 [Echinicola strongylocentroti]